MTSPARLALSVTAAVVAACGSSGGSSSPLLKVPVAASPQRGPADAWVTMVEFADFQCSFCRAEEPVVAHLGTVYGADLRLVFKHLPLTPIHDHAEHAAIAAECAGEQGKFWELHDLLLTTELDDATLLDDARAIPGLDVTAWQACLTSSEAAAVVDADLALAATVGIPGTPTFVVNGVLVVGAVPEDELRAAIGQARARAIASGIPRADYYDKAVMGP